jgi:hypothetical protein
MVYVLRRFREIAFHPEYGSSKLLRNVGKFKQNHMSQYGTSWRILWFKLRCLIEMLILNFPVRLTSEPGLLGPEKSRQEPTILLLFLKLVKK